MHASKTLLSIAMPYPALCLERHKSAVLHAHTNPQSDTRMHPLILSGNSTHTTRVKPLLHICSWHGHPWKQQAKSLRLAAAHALAAIIGQWFRVG